MGIKELIQNLGNKSRERKEMMRVADDQLRIQKMLEDRSKSANERELERFMKEEREVQIKEALDIHRKQRDQDIKFNHNSIDTPNITNHVSWEVMKEKNMFTNKGNMFAGQGASVLQNNNKLLQNNRRLFGI